jgi:hypothetical protein
MTQTAKRIYSEETFPVFLQTEVKSNVAPVDERFVPKIENKLFSEVRPFFYNKRLRLSFFISEEFKSRFALITGLIEFHRLNRFSFRYNADEKTLETEIQPEQIRDLEIFLGEVLRWTREELKFKELLKQVMYFEKQWRTLSGPVYTKLMKA